MGREPGGSLSKLASGPRRPANGAMLGCLTERTSCWSSVANHILKHLSAVSETNVCETLLRESSPIDEIGNRTTPNRTPSF
jgi:hypothetical protein